MILSYDMLTIEELKEHLKLRPYEKNWEGVYGSPHQIGYRRRQIWLDDMVEGLLYAPSDDALAFGAVRYLVTKIENNTVYCQVYSMGKENVKTYMPLTEITYMNYVLEEQTDEVLMALYKKGCFAKDYRKDRVDAIVAAYKKEMEKEANEDKMASST